MDRGRSGCGLFLLESLMRLAIVGLILTTALPVHAAAETCDVNIHARFIEGAPRDRFVIENKSTAGLEIASLELDLRPSAGRLIFDTENGGDGVEVFQLFRTENGDARLAAQPAIKDGDDRMALSFSKFGTGQRYQFSIDVDDRLTNSDLGQIRVSGGEMQGAQLIAAAADGSQYRGTFDGNNRARLTQNCQ